MGGHPLAHLRAELFLLSAEGHVHGLRVVVAFRSESDYLCIAVARSASLPRLK
jgi:hypothetical protein